MTVMWNYVKPLKSDRAVASFCNEKGVRLPSELIAFLEAHNGGRPSEKAFDTDLESGYVFNSLLSYNEGDPYDIHGVYSDFYADSGLYPVAIEAAGNMICLDLRKGGFVLHNHETDGLERVVAASCDTFAELEQLMRA